MSDPGWRIAPYDPAIASWADHARPVAQAAIADPENAHWLRYQNTWFAGVDCLPNDQTGRLPGGPALQGRVLDALPRLPLHPAQVSAIFPGYPKPMDGESEAAAKYRAKRDAAHVDGLLPLGPERRRFLREPHAYILGLPLTETPPDASPLIVWEGSHHVMAKAFQSVFQDLPAEQWPDVDVTAVYHAARRECFESCRRVPVAARPGEAILLHRLMLHGMAPWTSSSDVPRLIAYFRPQGNFADWPVL